MVVWLCVTGIVDGADICIVVDVDGIAVVDLDSCAVVLSAAEVVVAV